MGSVTILQGDCREVLQTLPDQSAHMCMTSPPYFGLRSYLRDDSPLKPLEMGLEATPEEFIAGMVAVFRQVRRVLCDDGTLWLNIGDSYAGSRAGPQGISGQMADRSVAAARCREASDGAIVRGKRDAKRWGGGNAAHGGDIKPKDLIGIPWMLAFALRADGWYLRQDLIWSKPNPMPESVTDRCTKAHEYLFLLSKSPRYYFDQDAILEPSSPNTHARLAQNGLAQQAGSDRVPGKTNGAMKAVGRKFDPAAGNKNNTSFDAAMSVMPSERNKRSVWTVATQPFKEAHFATFPPALIEPCILAGAPVGGMVLDPFGGSGTTGMVAQKLGRSATLIDLNPDYQPMMDRRIRNGDIGLPLGAAA